jgi:hypothetical protein
MDSYRISTTGRKSPGEQPNTRKHELLDNQKTPQTGHESRKSPGNYRRMRLIDFEKRVNKSYSLAGTDLCATCHVWPIWPIPYEK